ncbi:MAG: flagellar export protein FliJ [Candidatus Latescibacterota bacterium]|nr:flagellar export protein FliJ [Candidatus Latescibacterota bacterium]
MKRFRYRFQRILEVKEGVENLRRAELAEVISVINKEKAQLEFVNRVKQKHMSSDRGKKALRFNVELLRTGANYSLMLQRNIEEQKEQIQKIESVVEDKRKSLLEAEKERRVYGKLKDREQKLYLKEQKKEERKQLDQVGERIHHQKFRIPKDEMEGTVLYDGIN